MTLDELISRFNGKRCGSYAMFKCPSHDDKQASLSVAQGPERLLMKCHAGCATKAILDAWGLAWNDVLPPREGTPEQTWTIRDENGVAIAEHVRIEDASGGKRFVWRRNGASGLGGIKTSDLPLYGAELIHGKAKA